VKTVLLLPLPEIGHCAPAIRIARRLRARGNTVKWLALPAICGHLENAGEEVLPLVSLLRGNLTGHLQERRALIEAAADGRFAQFVRALSPDVVVVDVILSLLLLPLQEIGIPGLTLSVTLPDDIDAKALSPWLDYTPSSGLWGSIKRRVLFAGLHLVAWILRLYDFENLVDMGRRSLIGQQLPKTILRRPGFTVLYHLPVPELIACSETFDFPREQVLHRHFVGPCVEAMKNLVPFPFDELDGRPLVVCAFGSMAHRYRGHRNALCRILEIARERPQWQWVVSTGQAFSTSTDIPANVIAREWLPQWELLQRAALFITHGGMASVKESILAGVPMLIIPGACDQPGNAARVMHWGMGLKIDAKATKGRLAGAIDRLLTEPGFRAATRKMQAHFIKDNESSRAEQLIEQTAECPLTQIPFTPRWNQWPMDTRMPSKDGAIPPACMDLHVEGKESDNNTFVLNSRNEPKE